MTMRSLLAGLAVLGLVSSLAVVAAPAQAGCSSLVAQPTGCATAIYYSAKKNAAGAVGNAGFYVSSVPGYAMACGQVPEVGVEVPMVPAMPAPPGTEPAAGWADAVQGSFGAFRDTPIESVGPGAATFIRAGFDATMLVVSYYSDASDSFLLTFVPETLPQHPDDLPGVPAAPEAPEVPDATAGFEALNAYVSAYATAVQDGAGAAVTCVQAMPSP